MAPLSSSQFSRPSSFLFSVALVLVVVQLSCAQEIGSCPQQYIKPQTGRCHIRIGVVAQSLYDAPTGGTTLDAIQPKSLGALQKLYADHFASLPKDGTPLRYTFDQLDACASGKLPCPFLGYHNDMHKLILRSMLNATYDIYVYSSFGGALYGTRVNEVDVAWIGAVRTASRDTCTDKCKLLPQNTWRTGGNLTSTFVCCLDFGPAYYVGGLSVLTKKSTVSASMDPSSILKVFDLNLVRYCIYFAAALVFTAYLFVFYERQLPRAFTSVVDKKWSPVDAEKGEASHLADDLGPEMAKGMYWGLVTATSIGYGDIVPVTPLGRLMAMIWMLVGLAFSGILIGFIGSGFVELRAEAKVPTSVDDLRGKKVCVADGYYEDWLKSKSAVLTQVKCGELTSCVSKLEKDECNYVLYEKQYLSNYFRLNLISADDYMTSMPFEIMDQSLAFAERSPLWQIFSAAVMNIPQETADTLAKTWVGHTPQETFIIDEIDGDEVTAKLANWEVLLAYVTSGAIFVVLVISFFVWMSKRKSQPSTSSADEKKASEEVDETEVKLTGVTSETSEDMSSLSTKLESILGSITERLQANQETAMDSLREEMKMEIKAMSKLVNRSPVSSPKRGKRSKSDDDEGSGADLGATSDALAKLSDEVTSLRKTLDDNTVSTQDMAYLLTKQGNSLEEVTEKVSRSEMRMDEWNVMLAAQAEEISDLMEHVNDKSK
ncbi:potassium voltage-gated channel [Pycnococcus provasolii]